MFSKSFGYALRGILVIVFLRNEKPRIHVDEIASLLSVPRFFMSKVLKNLAKQGILGSGKGPRGGFYVNEQTISTTIFRVLMITDGDAHFRNCALQLNECNLQNPCPLHHHIVTVRNELKHLMESTTIDDLINGHNGEFLLSLSSQKSLKKIIPVL